MKYFLTILLIVGYHVLYQVTDYNETVRFYKCTLETNDFDSCEKGASDLYKFLLKIEVPQLYQCVGASGNDNFLCHLFNIERAK